MRTRNRSMPPAAARSEPEVFKRGQTHLSFPASHFVSQIIGTSFIMHQAASLAPSSTWWCLLL